MSSMIEFIRQLNQTSVTLESDWLTRLRYVDVGIEDALPTPEIVMTTDGTKVADVGVPPVTMVKATTPPPAGFSMEATAVSSYEQVASQTSTTEQVTRDPVYATTTNVTANHNVARTKTEESAESQKSVPQPPTLEDTTTLSTEPVTTDDRPVFVETAPGPQTTSSQAARVETASIQTAPESVPESVPVKPPSSTTYQTVSAIGSMIPPAVMNPDAFSGIVAPTIIPDRGPTADMQPVRPVPKTETTQFQVATPELTSGTTATTTVNSTTPNQVELPEHLVTDADVDTVDQETIQQIKVDLDRQTQTTECSMQLPETTPTIPLTSSNLTVDQTKVVAYPKDRRGQRFDYTQTKRQKLVDSIVDQVVERFPSPANATLMFVGVTREIDVDSAASRIATCMANRDLGQVALIDGNQMSGQITQLFGLQSETGIADAIFADEPANQLAVSTENTSLKVIGTGLKDLSGVGNQIPNAKRTTESLRNSFEYSIISGGVAGDELTDAWSSLVDGVYVIVDMDQTDRDATIRTVDYFRQKGVRIVGCIATRA